MAQRTKRSKKATAKPGQTGRPVINEEEGWRGLWMRLSESTRHVVCLLFLLAVSLAFFAPIHFSGRTLAAGDIVNWRATAADLIEYEEATGEEPLWAPNAFAGMPGYKIYYPLVVPQIDDVPRLLRRVIWPTSHFIFLLAGAYLLIFFLTKNNLAGVLGAVGYGLTTYLHLLLVAGHNSKFVALAFAPWLVLAFAYALKKPKLLSGLLFAIALAVHLRAGHEQITYYLAFLLGFWWLVEAIGAVRHGRLKSFGVATSWMVLGTVLALLMVAQPFLPLLEYKEYTIRGSAGAADAGALDWSYAMSWSQGFSELVTLLIADAFGGGGSTYWGPKPFTAGPHYVGGIVILLAILAVWRVRRNVVWGLAIGVFFMILFSLGEHLAWFNRLFFDYFPLFDAFRVPETWLSVVAFSLAILAAFGINEAVRREPSPEQDRRQTRAIYTVLGIVGGFVLLLFLARSTLFDFERPNERQEISYQIAQSNNVSPTDPRVTQAAEQYVTRVKEERVDGFTSDALRTLLFIALAGLALFLYRRGSIPAWVLQSALTLLILIDLWGVGRRYLNEDALAPVSQIEDQIQTYDFDRFLIEQGGEERGKFRVLSLEGNPQTTARPSYYFESLGGYHGAKLRVYQDFLDHLLLDSATGLPNEQILDMMNTRYVVSPGPFPGMELVFQSETGFAVLENPDVLPRAFFVGQVETVQSPDEMLTRLQDSAFEPSQTAVVLEELALTPAPVDSGAMAAAELVSYSPHEIEWNVRTDAPRLLVVSEVYYPAGWKARIDGEEVPILRTNYLLRGVVVPEGEHTVTMSFEPRGHRLGVLISGLATALVYGGTLLLFGLAYFRKRKPEKTGEETTEAA